MQNSKQKNEFMSKMIKSGLTIKEAESIIDVIFSINENNMENISTKRDIDKLHYFIEKIFLEIEKMELRMIIKLGSLLTVSITIIGLIYSS